jgi:hypothetical protein
MRPPLAAVLTSSGLAIAAAFPCLASAQAPPAVPRQIEREAPTRFTPGQPTAPPTPDAAATTAAASGDTTTPPSGAGNAPTQVTGASSGMTTLPTGSQATSSSSQAMTMDKRSYTAGRSMLTLEGQTVETRTLEGGVLVGTVATNDLGPDNLPKKHLAGNTLEPITIQAGLEAKPLLDWIAQTWKGNFATKNGSILITDNAGTVFSQRDFNAGLITEVTVPDLDGSSKAAGFLTVKIAPERILTTAGKGTVSRPSTLKQKAWMTSNFRFEMDGLDASRVARIASFTVVQQIAGDQIGTTREPTKHPARLEFPNLQVSLSEAGSQKWADWYQDFVVNGNSTEDKEKNGAILFLGPDQKAELGRINLYNCGIFRFAPDKVEAGADRIRRLTADLYCERMELDAKGSVN